jgi:hypothetical protein
LDFIYVLFGDAPALPPPARFYQRLLAGEQDQAWDILQREMQTRPLEEAYDDVVLPALSLAARDLQNGTLDAEAEGHLADTMKLLLAEAGDAPRPVPETPLVLDAMPLRILCVPARGGTDPMASTMLAQVLSREGMEVEVARLDELSSATLKSLETRQVDMVFISAVPPSRFVYVRYLCKQIQSRYPDMPILVGMWALDRTSREFAEQVPSLRDVQVATSLVEAREFVARLAHELRVQRESRLAASEGTSKLG